MTRTIFRCSGDSLNLNNQREIFHTGSKKWGILRMFILHLDGIRFLPNFRFWPFGSSPKSLCNWNVRDWRVHPQSRDVFFGRPGMKTNSKNSLLLHSTSVLKVVGIDKKDHRALGEWGGRAGQGRVSFLSLDFDFFTSFMQITNERFRRAVQFCPARSRIGLKLKVSRFGKLVYFHP